jgi:hypothetical protein
MFAVAVGPRPDPALLKAPATAKLAAPVKPLVGVNLRPLKPSAAVMKLLLLICVTPFVLKSVPLVIAVILKKVAPPFAVMTRPEVVCVLTCVPAFVTDGAGAKATALMLIAACRTASASEVQLMVTDGAPGSVLVT